MATGSSASGEHLQLNPRPAGCDAAFFWTFAALFVVLQLVPLSAFFASSASALLFLPLTLPLFDRRDLMSYNSISGALAMPNRKIPHPGGAELVLLRRAWWKNLALEEHLIGRAHVGLGRMGKEPSRHRYPELEVVVLRVAGLALAIIIFVDGRREIRGRKGRLFYLKGLPFLWWSHCHCLDFFHLFFGGKGG
ncbi:hypothetical protein BHE74_00016281 [Ensete ventricosum]|nr:hypothetical protein BHE74_00016281 [Ensete ventricosum]